MFVARSRHGRNTLTVLQIDVCPGQVLPDMVRPNTPPRPLQISIYTPQYKERYSQPFTMAMFRAKKLDISGYINIKIIRDHTKRLSSWKPFCKRR